jgi:hypothetical protein
MIEAEMAKARKAKAEPSSENGKSQRRTGFVRGELGSGSSLGQLQD